MSKGTACKAGARILKSSGSAEGGPLKTVNNHSVQERGASESCGLIMYEKGGMKKKKKLKINYTRMEKVVRRLIGRLKASQVASSDSFPRPHIHLPK